MNSLFVAALLASASPAASPSSLAWQSDYTLARELASQQHKPLAVFVGSGSEGWSQVVRNESIDSRTLNLLTEKYICIYADRTTEMGAKMASALQVSNSTGLVISDRTGKVQAFSHDGAMSSTDLQRAVEKYSDAARVVTATETVPSSGIVQTSYSVVPSMNVGAGSPTMISVNGMYVQTPTQMYHPSYPAPVRYQPSYYPSSCPNGNCGAATYSSCPNGNCGVPTFSSCPNGRCPK